MAINATFLPLHRSLTTVEAVRAIRSTSENDQFDITWKYPERLGRGTYREIQLRQGVELAIDRCQLHDDLIVQCPERSHSLEYVFRMAETPSSSSTAARQYGLRGSSMAPIENEGKLAAGTSILINVHIEPALFQTFLGDRIYGRK